METKSISKIELKNILKDRYDDFMKSCEEDNRYAGSEFIFIQIGDEVYMVLE